MKTSTVLILLGGVAALGAGAFFIFRRGDQIPILAGPGSTATATNPALLNQPSQLYPVTQTGVTNRQDTASQPWYGGSRPQDVTANLVDQNLVKNASMLSGVASITSSLSSIWDDLNISSWWSDDSSSSLSSEDMFSDFSWNSYLGSWN